MRTGTNLPDWSKLKVRKGQEAVFKVQGQKRPVTARNKKQYFRLKRQRLATRQVINWYVRKIPVAM